MKLPSDEANSLGKKYSVSADMKCNSVQLL